MMSLQITWILQRQTHSSRSILRFDQQLLLVINDPDVKWHLYSVIVSTLFAPFLHQAAKMLQNLFVHYFLVPAHVRYLPPNIDGNDVSRLFFAQFCLSLLCKSMLFWPLTLIAKYFYLIRSH